ncbi:MAG TPA: arginase [Ktedonobacterales bacterium]|jgi:arginase|nr:arginase [Ktedonobacterales bacterium]
MARADTAYMEITILGAPMDLGADRRGVDMGPSAIRYAGLDEKLRALGHKVHDAGNVHVPVAETRSAGNPRLKYLDQIVACAGELAARTRAAVAAGSVPIVLGGDHSIALGSISGVANALGTIGVIWLDAHADFNTVETSPSGNIHGMILASLAGYGEPVLVNAGGPGPHVAPGRIVIVGARDLDAGERDLLRQAGVHVRSMSEIDRRGIHEVTREAIALASDGANGLHVSFDMDVVDPTEAPGVGTPVPGGITYREAHLAMELVAESGRLVAMDLVEVNPILDRENRTANLATELALSALGKRIY